MAFGDRLKLLRDEKGLTQKDVADVLKVERPTIAGYETNRKQPDYEKINTLADYFNVSLDYLLGRSHIRNPYESDSGKTKNKSLGKIIFEYRKQNKLSLEEFADKSKLDYEYIENLEKSINKNQPDLTTICKLSKVMHISETKLLEEIGYIKSNPESDKILKRSNELLEDYIKNNKNDDENKIRSKGLYTTLLIKKLFEDGLISDDGEIDDSYLELIKASLKTDSKLLRKDEK